MSYSRLPAIWPAPSCLFKAAYHMEPKTTHVIGWRMYGIELQPCYRHGDIEGAGTR